jgi:hypothetical protein
VATASKEPLLSNEKVPTYAPLVARYARVAETERGPTVHLVDLQDANESHVTTPSGFKGSGGRQQAMTKKLSKDQLDSSKN